MELKKTRVLVILILILSQLFIRLPDFVRWQNTPFDRWFTGQVSWFDPWDMNVYFSAIGWGRRDGLLFDNLYDTQPTEPMPIYTVYTILGKLFSSLSLSNAAIFHVAAVFTGLFVSWVVWWVSSVFFSKQSERLLVLFFALIGGGLGWILYPRIIIPDLSQPGFTLYSALRRPHEALSYSLFLLTIVYFYNAVTNKQNQLLRYFTAAVWLFLLLLFHPYSILPVGLVLTAYGVYWVAKTESLKNLTPAVFIVLVGTIYYLFIGRSLVANPSFAGLAGQVQSSPSPLRTILGWGLLFAFVVVALFTPGKNNRDGFLKIWFSAHWALLYLPLGFQRLLVRGLWVCVVILAVKGILIVSQKYKIKWVYLAALSVLLVSLSSLSIFAHRFKEPSTNRWIYITDGEKQIIDFLNRVGKEEEGVLAGYRLANILPANTNKRVYAGHEFQTPNFYERIAAVNQFYTGALDEDEAKKFLQQAGVKWVIWGLDEKAIAGLENLPYSSLLQPMLETEQASLYKVF